MRRLWPALIAVIGAVVIAGCGQSSASHGPLSSELSYFPADSPVIATVSTATHGTSASQLQRLQASTPSATVVKAGVFQELATLGIDYNRDVKPLLGNPIAFGVGSARIGAGQTAFLAAWQTRSAAALGRLVRSIHALSRAGSHDGATLYAAHGFAVAVAGTEVLVARDTVQLDAALDRHASAGGFTTADYGRDTAGLPAGGALTVVGDLATALSGPSAARARRVPWVAALRGYGLALTASAHQLAMHFRVQTSGRTLSPGQLPIGSGSSSPGVAGILPIEAGLRDPAAVYTFVKGALRSVAPSRYAKLMRELRAAQRRSGIDVDRLASSLTGDLELTSDGHTTIGRVPIAAGERAPLEKALADPMGGDRSVALGGGLYRIVPAHGRPTIVGVVDGELVAGRATPAEVRGYATAPAAPVPATHGALAVRVAVGQLVALSGSGLGNPYASRLISMLGDLTGSVQATPQALTGAATLAIK